MHHFIWKSILVQNDGASPTLPSACANKSLGDRLHTLRDSTAENDGGDGK
ncbi:MAG: hypothetical protein GY774_08625 [Planctomycetes bacterium]|nr:hypothetical protein [Planctomycetota bacterium]